MPSSACDWSSDVCSSDRSEEHTSELQSRSDLVCRLLLEKKKNRHELRTDSPYQTGTTLRHDTARDTADRARAPPATLRNDQRFADAACGNTADVPNTAIR